MNLKQLYIFGMENSQEPVIKNPVLRAALEKPRTMAQGGGIIGKPGGLVEPGVEYYATSKIKKGKFIYPRKNRFGTVYSDTPAKGSARDLIDQKGIGKKILEEYADGDSTVTIAKKYKLSKDTVNRYITKKKPTLLRSASQGINQYGFDESVIDEIKIDAEEGLSKKEILEKHKGKISKNKLKEVIDVENIEVEPYYKEGEVKGYKHSMEDLKKFASEEQNAKLAQAKKDLKSNKITQKQYSDIEFKYRKNALNKKRWSDQPYEVRRQKYLDIEASKTVEQKAADAARKHTYQTKKYAEFGMDPVPKNSKDMLWRDISRSAREGGPDGRIKLAEGKLKVKPGHSYDDFINRKFIDTKTGVKFGYDDLEKYLNSGKAGKYKYDDVIKPYEMKYQINKLGLREEINKNFFGKKYKGRSLYNPQNAFDVHHVAGVANDPFNVQFTFSDQNRNLITNKKFNKEFKNLIDNNATYTQKKNFIKSATDRIGDDIAQQFGKKQYGTRGGRLPGMFEKVGLDLNRPEVKKLIKLGCGMYAGGRVGFSVGSGKCINRAIAKLKSGNLTTVEKKLMSGLGDDLTKIAGKGGMPKGFWTTALKGEGYFALADFANNLTKGQSLDKSFSNAVEMATFTLVDLGGNERDLMKYAKERGLDTKDMEEWMNYAQTYGKYVEGHKDLAEREKIIEASGGEEEYWKNYSPNVILNPEGDTGGMDELWEAEKKIERAEKQLEEKGKSETIQSGKGYKDMNEMIEGVVAKEWNKPAGVPGLDRGYRKMLGMKGDEGLVWGPIGSMFREGAEKVGFGEHDSLKKFTPQTVMNYHPVYGYKEDIKDVIRQGDSPMEDMLEFMKENYPSSGLIQEALREVAEEKEVEKWVDTGFGREKRKVKTDMGSYDYDPNLAEGGIASLKKW
jgi:hypothetical protein